MMGLHAHCEQRVDVKEGARMRGNLGQHLCNVNVGLCMFFVWYVFFCSLSVYCAGTK